MDDRRAAMDELDPERRVKFFVNEGRNRHGDGSVPSRGCNLFEQPSAMPRPISSAPRSFHSFQNEGTSSPENPVDYVFRLSTPHARQSVLSVSVGGDAFSSRSLG